MGTEDVVTDGAQIWILDVTDPSGNGSTRMEIYRADSTPHVTILQGGAITFQTGEGKTDVVVVDDDSLGITFTDRNRDTRMISAHSSKEAATEVGRFWTEEVNAKPKIERSTKTPAPSLP